MEEFLFDFNFSTPDPKSTQKSLSSVAERGYDGIVRLLLEQEDTDPNTPDTNTKSNRTPLLRATINGHEGIVKMPFQPKDLSPSIPDLGSKTALEIATSRGHAGVVRSPPKHKSSLSAPIDTTRAENMRRETLPQGTTPHKKRTIPPGDDENPGKKHRAFLT